MAEEKREEPQKIEPKIEPSVEPKQYEMHIRVPAEMRTTLKTAAVLAHNMGDIPKPGLGHPEKEVA
jgi:hypothetical protein